MSWADPLQPVGPTRSGSQDHPSPPPLQCGRVWAKVGRTWVDPGRDRAKCGPKSTEIGRTLPKVRATSALGQISVDFDHADQARATIDRRWPETRQMFPSMWEPLGRFRSGHTYRSKRAGGEHGRRRAHAHAHADDEPPINDVWTRSAWMRLRGTLMRELENSGNPKARPKAPSLVQLRALRGQACVWRHRTSGPSFRSRRRPEPPLERGTPPFEFGRSLAPEIGRRRHHCRNLPKVGGHQPNSIDPAQLRPNSAHLVEFVSRLALNKMPASFKHVSDFSPTEEENQSHVGRSRPSLAEFAPKVAEH